MMLSKFIRAVVLAISMLAKAVIAPMSIVGALTMAYVGAAMSPALRARFTGTTRRARDSIPLVLADSRGIAATPFVAVITSVLVIVIGISLISTVVTNVDTILTATSPTSSFPLAGTIAQFIPVIYIAAIMGIAGVIGYAGISMAGDRFTNLIMAVLVVVIAIALGGTVVDSSATALTNINAATNTMTLAATIMPFVPVVYIAAILGLAGLSGLRALRRG